MGTCTRIWTEPLMIRTKYRSKFVNIRLWFKFLTLKIQNSNRSIESEQIYKYLSLEKSIQQIF